MSKKVAKDPSYLLILGVFRQIREEGAYLVGTEFVDPLDSTMAATIEDFLEAEAGSSPAWYSICQITLSQLEKDGIHSFHDPSRRFDETDLDTVFLTMAYPIVLTGDLARLMRASQSFGYEDTASRILSDVATLVRILESQGGNPLLYFHKELNRLIADLGIPEIIPLGLSEMDIYKPRLKKQRRKGPNP